MRDGKKKRLPNLFRAQVVIFFLCFTYKQYLKVIMPNFSKTFKGGYRFKNYSGQVQPDIISCKIPCQAIIPLRQGFGVEVKPLVKKGENVFAGQIIGRDDHSVSSPVHSPVKGIVEDIRRMNYLNGNVTMVFIRSTGLSAEISRLSGYCAQWPKLSSEKIEELIYLSGVSSLGKAGIPTNFKSSIIPPEEVQHLIINGIDSEPYRVSLDLLLQAENLVHFFAGVRILKRIMPNSRVHLAVEPADRMIINELSKLSSQVEWMDTYLLEPKYPQGRDEMLVSTILKQKFPYGYSAANIGVIVLNIEAVLNVYSAVTEGLPLIEKTVAFCGPNMSENLRYKIRVGTPLSEVVKERIKKGHCRLVLDSLLTGFNLDDFSVPVSRTFSKIIAIPENKEREFLAFIRPGLKCDSYTRAFLAQWLPKAQKFPDANQHGEERPCISCGYCEEVCPVRIIPHLLSKHVEREIIDEKLVNYGIFKCIECGLCNFVCPSKIPLLKHIKKGQEELSKEGLDRDKCVLTDFEVKGMEEFRSIYSRKA